uniref:Alpha-1,3-glucosyltransferase n=1 Tax=Homalodisca liturata TaxID=320908 RepID=A0A1B6HX31_9HEMI
MLLILLGVLIRLCVTLHSYSGQNKPPMFGDYEAQRHWMEITHNLPIEEWYFNSTNNDLMYWGLDYPPLTAYHSWLCGKVAASINASYVELHKSRGYESENHKIFMRFTVLIADIITFIPAIFVFYRQKNSVSIHIAKEYSVSTNEATKLSCLLALIYPGIILIDHGHFQYNCVSLGLFIFAVCAIVQERHLIASVLFCCALCYKQMELYHALPIFFYLLGQCWSVFKQKGILKAMLKLISIGVVVVVAFAFICFPFLRNTEQLLQLIVRLFPISRGVYEDKVANVWCAINVILKLKLMFSNQTMVKICLICTCLAVIPSCYDVLMNNSLVKFKYSLVNSALSFFLFSYQVHEKSILLAATPALLVLPYDPLISIWFLCISVFSMVPLFIKDQILLPYSALSLLFILTFTSSSFNKTNKISENSITSKGSMLKFMKQNIYKYLFYMSLVGCLALSICISFLSPPKKYPDLFPLIISVYSCLHFVAFLVYFNIRQWTLNRPNEIKSKYD